MIGNKGAGSYVTSAVKRKLFKHVGETTRSTYDYLHAGWGSSCWVCGAGTRLRIHNCQIPSAAFCSRVFRSKAVWHDRPLRNVGSRQRTHCRLHAVHTQIQGTCRFHPVFSFVRPSMRLRESDTPSPRRREARQKKSLDHSRRCIPVFLFLSLIHI